MNQILRNRMIARMDEVRGQVAERDELIEIIAIALLTRKNVFILGDTGQAKSAVINLFRAGITGARQFERLMSKQTDEEAVFGRLDLSSLIPGGVPEEVLEQDQHYQQLRRDLEAYLASNGPDRSKQIADLTAEMERYMLRCTPLQGWYHLYLYCYSKEHMKQSPSECKEVNVHGA